nr:immunoglobulin light chain junction region [Macaca mulatta]
FMQGLEFPWTF